MRNILQNTGDNVYIVYLDSFFIKLILKPLSLGLSVPDCSLSLGLHIGLRAGYLGLLNNPTHNIYVYIYISQEREKERQTVDG